MKHVSIYNDGCGFVVVISENGSTIYSDTVDSLDLIAYLNREIEK